MLVFAHGFADCRGQLLPPPNSGQNDRLSYGPRGVLKCDPVAWYRRRFCPLRLLKGELRDGGFAVVANFIKNIKSFECTSPVFPSLLSPACR